MRSSRTAPAPAVVALGLALAAPALAQAPPSVPGGDSGGYRSLADLNAAYEKQRGELDRREMADLTDLAARLKGAEADYAYHELFNMAIASDRYEPAARAADAYLSATNDGRDPELRGLAAVIGAVHKVNQKQYPEALQEVDRFLRGQTAERRLDPNTIFAVGEATLQRLIHAGRYDVARQACELFLRDDPDPAVKSHFSSRLARIELLGKPAPPIAAPDVDGRPVSLADLRGKVVLVDFWATWCPPCVNDLPAYRALRDKYGAKGFEILGVNLDAARQDVGTVDRAQPVVRRFLLQYRVSWPNVFNGAGATDFARAYGVGDLPATFLVDRDGKVIQVEPGMTELEKSLARALDGPEAGEIRSKE